MNKLRAVVLDRCEGRCERCGIPLSESFALHHRLLRSRGGKDELANLCALHHHCHNLGTDSVHLNPKRATQQGFIVPSGSDPASVPLRLRESSTVYLTAEGGYLLVEDGREHPSNYRW